MINREVIKKIIMLTCIIFCILFSEVIFANNSGNGNSDYDGIEEYTWSESDQTSFDEEEIPHDQKNQKITKTKYQRSRYVSTGNRKQKQFQGRKKKSRIKTARIKKSKNIRSSRAASVRVVRYRVKKRETLYRISRKFGVSVPSICRYNRLSNKNTIYSGMILKIPVPGTKKSKSVVREKRRSKKRQIVRKKSPVFKWPIQHVVSYKKDGRNGVKSIGITIKGRANSNVISSASGIVKRVGHMRGFGNYIVVTHPNRFATVYANLDKVFVSEGQKVNSGKALGKIDKENRMLHFQIDRAGKPANPLSYLPKRS